MLLDNREWRAINTPQDVHIFRSSGFDWVEQLRFNGVEPSTSEAPQRDLAVYGPALSGTLALRKKNNGRSPSAFVRDQSGDT
jgi:hypothetical protein